jgi:hypothetical protein
MERCLGEMPRSMIEASKHGSKYFDHNGKSRWQTCLSREGQRHVRRMRTLREFVAHDRDTGLLELLSCLLSTDPRERATASQALRSPFVDDRRR